MNSENKIGTLYPYFLVFLISPVFSIVMYLLNMWSNRSSSKYHYYGFFGLLALWLAGMNATKIPASDQIAYERMYKNVPNFTFLDALTNLKVDMSSSVSETYLEPVYKAFCYVGYYLTFGNSYWYFALVTFIIYMSIFYCIYRVLNYAGFEGKVIITGVILCAFFFQFFNETAHAIRQFLAGCIVIFAILKKNESGKNPWGLYVLALLSHKSTILIVLFSLIPVNFVERKKFLLISIIIVAVCTIFMSQFASSLMLWGLDNSYVLRRAAQESKEFSDMNKLVLYGVSVPIMFICLRALFMDNDETNKIKYFLFISLLLSVFVVSCTKNTLFLGRYFFYLYFIVPFVLPLLFKQRSVYRDPYLLALGGFMPLYFFTSFRTCLWQYADTIELLLYPYPYLLNYF